MLASALCVFAQGPATSIERMVASDAARHLGNKDPATRGEAALITSSVGDSQHEASLLALAEDPEPKARHRAIIALGLLATPAAVQHIESLLRPVDGRTSDDGVAAAFALGLVPPELVGTSVARTLPLFSRGSWKRQHDVLLALLLAMASNPERSEQRALRDLLDDESIRSTEIRALLLQLLLPIDRTLDADTLRRTLRRGSDDERQALLRWLANRPPKENADWLTELTHAAEHDSRPANRAAALLALTRRHHLPALEIAARALRSSAAIECGQALQAMLTIGGASTRGALEQHLLEERNAGRKAALLRSYRAPLSTRLADHALELATDRSQPLGLRAAAAELLSRSQPERAAPALRDLFRASTDRQELRSLARALHRVESAPTTLGRLLDDPVQLQKHPERWQALLAAGHGGAQRRVLAALQDRQSAPETTLTALAAWRTAMVLDVPRITGITVPERLLTMLR